MNNRNLPVIFTKNIKDTYNTIPLNIPNNTLGPNRHFPVSTKEWYNSVYSHDNNLLKNFNTKDKHLSNIIQSYFNFYFSNNLLKQQNVPIRYRRLSSNKIYVGKAELKHTNDKVIIDLNVFNQEKKSLIKNIRNSLKELMVAVKKRNMKLLSYKLWKLKEFNNSKSKYSLVKVLQLIYHKLAREIEYEKRKLFFSKKKRNTKKWQELEQLEFYLNILQSVISKAKIYVNKKNKNIYSKLCYKLIRIVRVEYELTNISKHKLLLDLNKSKFEYTFIYKLKELIKNIYKKKVELNIVNLNNIYLDVSIFTDAIAKKLKNRNNTALKTIAMGVNMVRIPHVNRYKLKYGIPHTNQTWLNKVQTLNINLLINKYNSNKDSLNKILFNIIPNPNKIYSSIIKNIKYKNLSKESLNILDIVYKSIKYRKIRGIRLEARGRLTRRYTASRALFKLKWQGGLKNVDSSYRGYSSTILRGHVRSNVQHYYSANHNRIGAYGIKGWISGR